MKIIIFIFQKLIFSIPIILGTTFISFILMVYFGPDQTYSLIGKNATLEQIQRIHHELGYDLGFWQRYFQFLYQTFTLDFGISNSTFEEVNDIFLKNIPISMLVIMPGFIFGNICSAILALISIHYHQKWQDKIISLTTTMLLSLSLLIIIIVLQVIFCSSYGLDLFPVQGFNASSIREYLNYIFIPTLSLILLQIGSNTSLFRMIFIEEYKKNHIKTLLAFGVPQHIILGKYLLKNSIIPILTRIIYSIPFIVIGGSLLIESYFNIPGLGSIVYDAIHSGDLPIIKAVVSLTTILYIIVIILTDIFYRILDPRISALNDE